MKILLTTLLTMLTFVQAMDESPNNQGQYPGWTFRLNSRRINICDGNPRGKQEYSHMSVENEKGFSVLLCKLILPGLISQHVYSDEATLANLTLLQRVNLDFKLYEDDGSLSSDFDIFGAISQKVCEKHRKFDDSSKIIAALYDEYEFQGKLPKPFCFFIECGNHKFDCDELVLDFLLKHASIPAGSIFPPLLNGLAKILSDGREAVELYNEHFNKRFPAPKIQDSNNNWSKLDDNAKMIVSKYLCPVGFEIVDRTNKISTLVKHILTTATEQAG